MASSDREFGYHYYARTKNQPHHFRLIWTVENFLQYPGDVDTVIISPNFILTSGYDYGVKFAVKIYPYGQPMHEDFISVHLFQQNLPKCITKVKVKLNISIFNKNRNKLHNESITTGPVSNTSGWGFPKFIKREELESKENEYLTDGHLTLECHVEAYFELEEPVYTTRIHSEIDSVSPANSVTDIMCLKNQPYYFKAIFTIENFLQYPAKVGTEIRSPPFESISDESLGLKWYLKIYPDGVSEEYKGNVSVKLCGHYWPKNISLMNVFFHVYCVGKNGQKLQGVVDSDEKVREFIYDNNWGWIYENFVNRSELDEQQEEWLPSGHLTLECNIKVFIAFNNPVLSSKIRRKPGPTKPSVVRSEIVKVIYQEKVCADVKLKAMDGRVFDAHKCVLSVRSPYFKAMFQHPMKENEDGMVDLSKDMNGQELETLLHYIYLGTPSDSLKDTARKMFQIGDMQGIPELRLLSEEELISQLDDSNAMELLNFAIKHGAKKLKKAAGMQIINSDK